MDRTTGILQQLVKGELTEKQVVKKLNKPLSQVRKMLADAIKNGEVTKAASVASAAEAMQEVGE